MSTITTVLGAVRAIIYDLDGTLYADTHHFDFYAHRLAAALPPERRAAFAADYAAAKAGEHPLRIGCLYDPERDLILTAMAGQVLTAQNWQGAVLPAAERERLYPGPVRVDHVQIFNVGDLWWVPVAIAVHHGLGAAACRQAFLETRDYMAGPEFQVAPIPGLRETMAGLRVRGVRQILATNSPRPDSETLLRKAGLAGFLDRCYFESQKPTGFPAVVDAVRREYDVAPAAILSVGDNYLNELAPARDMGLATAFIDPHDVGADLPCTLRVRRMVDLLPYLQRIGGPGA